MKQCQTAVLTGGGSRNEYLRKQISDYLRPQGIMVLDPKVAGNACARGALQHYMFEKDAPLLDGCFYVTQQETYNPNVHPKGASEDDNFDRRRKVVNDCLVPILSIVNGEGINPWGPVVQEFDISLPNEDSEAGSIHIYVYRSVGAEHPPEHTPLWHPVTRKMLPGIEAYPISFIDFTAATDCVRPRGTKKGKKRVYYVVGFIELRKVEDGVELVLKLMSKDFELRRGPGT